MVTKKPKGLGRGLEALLGPKVEEGGAPAPAAAEGAPSNLPVTELVAGMYQPRTRMDEGALYELAESIKVQGVMQPILVRQLSDGPNAGKYEIIAGERRFRASKLAGLDSVPVLVRDVPDESAAAMALIENIQREDLNPLEEAQGLQRLVREFGLTHEQAAQAVGRVRAVSSRPPSSDRRSSPVVIVRAQALAYFTRMVRSLTITPKSSVSRPAIPSAASSFSSKLRCCMRAARCRCGSTRGARRGTRRTCCRLWRPPPPAARWTRR